MFLLHILCVLDLKCIELLSTCVDVIQHDEAVALINTLTPTDNEQHLRFFSLSSARRFPAIARTASTNVRGLAHSAILQHLHRPR